MTDEDFEALIELVKAKLTEARLVEIADDDAYLVLKAEEGDGWRLPRPRDHLLELLDAFERHLLAIDRSTAHRALKTINASLDNGLLIDDIRIEPIPRAGTAGSGDVFKSEAFSILESPNNEECISALREFRQAIAETPDGEEAR